MYIREFEGNLWTTKTHSKGLIDFKYQAVIIKVVTEHPWSFGKKVLLRINPAAALPALLT